MCPPSKLSRRNCLVRMPPAAGTRELLFSLIVNLIVNALVISLNRQLSEALPLITVTNDSQTSQKLLTEDTNYSSTTTSNETSFSDADHKTASSIETSTLNYLQKYGYMRSNTEANNLISEESFSSAISSFQKFAGLPVTGIADEQTQRYMQLPRCGNKDKTQPDNQLEVGQTSILRRKKRYALQGSKWRRQELTYRISQYPTRFSGKKQEVDEQIEKAFGIWSQVAPIDFVVKREGRVHIDIRFASGDHGDGDAFDGPGNTLAHAYFPQYGGDAHFDDQEYWTIDSYTGTNIFQVAAHELGHSLGLGHSNVREALMAPFYQKYKPNFRLHGDDVLAIQALYGEKPLFPELSQPVSTSPTTTTTTTTTSTTTSLPPSFVNHPNIRYKGGKPMFWGSSGQDSRHELGGTDFEMPDLSSMDDNGIGSDARNGADGARTSRSQPVDLCTDPKIDAITRTADGQSYVFKGDYYWLLTREGLAKGYPRKISADWDGLPGYIDAALTWADGKTFFFKGNKYWRFRNQHRDVGYPKLISTGFAGIPDNIDAAFVWSGNGRTYLFKGAEYWRFDSKADPPVSSEYPRSIKVWNGVPAYIDAAFRAENNVTYFFKGNNYYRFNDKEFKVEPRGRPPFPRPSAEWWFGCVTSNLAQVALSSSLKDNTETKSIEVVNNQDTDWSFFSGLDENTRIFGTHINDHKPESPSSLNDSSTQVNNVGHRVSFTRPKLASSSAISPLIVSQFYCLTILLSVLSTSTASMMESIIFR